MTKVIYTIGHSTRPIEEFLALLDNYEIKAVADVRSIPKSMHNPQYNAENLKISLQKGKTSYEHITKLGGLRHTTKDSLNTGWHNLSFRGFADYMQTPSFLEGIGELEEMAEDKLTVIMCAEALPWRCHRSLIADALKLRKWKVYHIQSKTGAKLHTLTPFLKLRGGIITYPE